MRRALIIALALVASACSSGDRPTLQEPVPPPTDPTGNDDIDAVLALLDSVDTALFTADYRIETKFGTLESSATVVRASGGRLSVTVRNDSRDIQFTIDGLDQTTCDLRSNTCDAELNNARISDTQLGYQFYAPAFAARLRADAIRRIGDPEGYTAEFAGETAQCVDVVVSGGTKTYCALETGPLAHFVGADVAVEVTGYSPDPDLTVFDT